MVRSAPANAVTNKTSHAKTAESSLQGAEQMQEQQNMMEGGSNAGFSFKKGFDLAKIPAKTGLQTGIEEAHQQETSATEATGGYDASHALIIDDTSPQAAEEQMRKTDFLQQLRAEISATIGPILATVGQTTEGCPYLNYWLNLYQEKSAEEVEATVKRYAPDAANATTAAQYILVVTQRAQRAAQVWARTGRLSGIPEGVPTTLPTGRGTPQQAAPASQTDAGVMQAKEKNGGAKNVDSPVAIKKQLGHGLPLDAGVRTRMETAFGTSFSHVRTHTDVNSASISNRVNARAFTVGEHIAFGSGEYKPGTLIGDALIAHELAHTIQQRGAATTVEKMEPGSDSYNQLEKDADTTAAGVISSLWGEAKNGLQSIGQRVMPQLRSGLRIQGCPNNTPQQQPPTQQQQPAAPSTVTFTGTACSAFDDTVTPHAMMVKTGGTNTFNAQITPAAAAAAVSFESTDTARATVTPATATGSPQVVTVTGVAAGPPAEIQAKNAATGTVLARLEVDVKNNLARTMAIHSITETHETPNLVPVHAPAAAALQTYLNDVTWGKQANVTFTVTRTDFNAAYDLDASHRLADPALVSRTAAEMNVISAAARDTSVNFNIYYVNSMEVPSAFTPVGGTETWVDDTQNSSTENTTAHETGHLLGRWNHSTDAHDLMVDGDPGTNPCEIRKTDWDTVNP